MPAEDCGAIARLEDTFIFLQHVRPLGNVLSEMPHLISFLILSGKPPTLPTLFLLEKQPATALKARLYKLGGSSDMFSE